MAPKQPTSRPRKHLGKIILILVVLSIVSVLTQVFWPGKRFMFATKVGGVDVSNLTQEEARERVSEIFTDHTLIIEAKDGTPIYSTAVPLDQIAIDTMLIDELEYPLWQRLIPFSSFTRVFRSNWLGALVNLEVDEIISAIPDAPTDAHLSIVDGQVTVTEARASATIDRDDLSRRLSTIRLSANGRTTLRIPAEVILPGVTDADLASLLAKSPEEIYPTLISTFQGSDFSLSAINLKNDSWDISVDADEVWTAASTYKLFVAYFIMKKVDSGELTYDSVKPCMERMIIDSDNACPESWLLRYGLKTIESAIHAIGDLDQTTIAEYDNRTTARNLTAFLAKLYSGDLLSEESTNHLLDIMERQRFRDGIPAGVDGNSVASKVGFMFGLLHDAAIVYSDSGDYALVILTNDSSWDNISDLAHIINAFNNH